MRRGSAEHSTGPLTCRFAVIPLWRHRAVRPSVRTGNGPPPSATRSACPWPDSNGRPSAPEADALSTLSYTGSGPDDTELTTGAVDSGSPRSWRADSFEHMFRTTCSFDGCANKHRARGLCSSHLDQLARGKELTPLLGPHGRKHERCALPDCARRHHAGGLCTGHATQRQRGQPLRRLGGEGVWVDPKGYVWIRCPEPEHPNAKSKRGWIAEHVWVMSQVLGRPLRRGESVHHRNNIKHDNRPREPAAVAHPPAEGGRRRGHRQVGPLVPGGIRRGVPGMRT